MDKFAVLAIILAVVSVVRVRISNWPITGPMIFVGVGMLLSSDALGVLDFDIEDEGVVLAAELTLGLLLFADAARIDTATLRTTFSLPARLLGIGLPLSIALGTLLARLILPELSWSEAALLSAVLAPTDAALGQAVVTNSKVPVRIRQTLNVESGLNDGLVVPVIAIFSALTVGGVLESRGSIAGEAVTEIAIGLGVGALLGFLLGRVNSWVFSHHWTDEGGAQLVAFSAAIVGFSGATTLGGNGFIAAFVCGLAVRAFIGRRASDHVELSENIGQIGAEATFVIFGATMVLPAISEITVPIAILVIALLTVGRILPVALSMIGTGLKRPTVLFLGWFGPRGLASLLFGLLILAEEAERSGKLFTIVTLTIFCSVVLHGISAAPIATAYSKWFAKFGRPDLAELEGMVESPIRWRRTKKMSE